MSSSAERQARLRRRRRESRTWDPDAQGQGLGGWVAPFPHLGDERIYNTYGCQCRGCLAAHRDHNHVGRIGADITTPLTLGDLSATALQRVISVPPPPPPQPPHGAPDDRARRGRHRA